MIKKIFSLVLLVTVLLFSLPEAAQQEFPFQIKGDVPYVPTPQNVVDEMLRMAELKPDDLLYDLGCGDGRIVVTAAKKYGVRAIGIDIDPERIMDSRKNAAEAGVEKLVEFREQDLFKADFKDATIITLYLLTKVNLDLRPKFLRELLPGTRLVSHRFGMGEWLPDKTTEVKNEGDPHPVHFWVVPANASGTWELTLDDSSFPEASRIEIEQLFQNIHGNLIIQKKSYPLWNTSLVGDKIRFTIKLDDEEAVRLFEGTIHGHSVQGTMTRKGHYLGTEYPWKGRRNPASQKPLDGGN